MCRGDNANLLCYISTLGAVLKPRLVPEVTRTSSCSHSSVSLVKMTQACGGWVNTGNTVHTSASPQHPHCSIG
jgi:hypothetical protein